jgi:putative N6-adenine-specific DNA methylase
MLGSRLGSENKWKSLISTSIDNANENIERQRGDPTAKLIVGTDRNKGAIAAALGNAERAGVLDLVKLEHQAISAVDWFENPTNAPSRVLVATNPPFGRRVSSKNKGTEKPLLPLYQTLGHKVGNLQGTVDFSILAQDTNLARKTAIRNLSLNFASKHGGLNVFILGAKDIALRNDK